MKKVFILFFASTLILSSCKKEEVVRDYATISGKISNASSTMVIVNGPDFKREISVNKDGSFSDTITVKDGFYMLEHQPNQTFVFLKNGYNLQANFDANDLSNSISFAGLGAGTNNYMVSKSRFEAKEGLENYNSFFELDKPTFDAKINALKATMSNLIANANDLDSGFVDYENRSNEQFIRYLTSNYQQKHELLKILGKGKPSPKFNYPNLDGKNVALDDLKGKYVYVDVWATWCGPCKREIPYLKELEDEYHDKNITFVGLSIDEQKNIDKWKRMVGQRDLKGIQILADKDWNSQFVQDYRITGIPRFILIDPKGNIVSSDAPRPSDPQLKKLFNELNI